jgi:hypothetical protein
MSYALYRGRKWLGPLASIGGYGQLIEAIKAFNKHGGAGKIPTLSNFILSGTSDDPRQVAKDISTLLAESEHLDKDAISTFRNLKRLLKGVTRSITVGES